MPPHNISGCYLSMNTVTHKYKTIEDEKDKNWNIMDVGRFTHFELRKEQRD